MKRPLLLIIILWIIFPLISNSYAGDNTSKKFKEVRNKLQSTKEKGYIEDEIIVIFKPAYAKTLASLKQKEVINKVSLKMKELNLNFKKIRRLGPNSRFFFDQA